MWKRIKRQLDKLPNSPGLIRSGNWYVMYNDGRRSRLLTYDVAGDYADIFGGMVFHKDDKPTEKGD